MRIQFAQSARRHKIGKAHALFVIENHAAEEVVSNSGVDALRWVGEDDRGLELAVIAIVKEGDPEDLRPRYREDVLLVIHVQPTGLGK